MEFRYGCVTEFLKKSERKTGSRLLLAGYMNIAIGRSRWEGTSRLSLCWAGLLGDATLYKALPVPYVRHCVHPPLPQPLTTTAATAAPA